MSGIPTLDAPDHRGNGRRGNRPRVCPADGQEPAPRSPSQARRQSTTSGQPTTKPLGCRVEDVAEDFAFISRLATGLGCGCETHVQLHEAIHDRKAADRNDRVGWHCHSIAFARTGSPARRCRPGRRGDRFVSGKSNTTEVRHPQALCRPTRRCWNRNRWTLFMSACPTPCTIRQSAPRLSRGLHVYLRETSGALSARGARTWLSRLSRPGLVLMPGYHLRFHEHFLRAAPLAAGKTPWQDPADSGQRGLFRTIPGLGPEKRLVS